MEMRTTYSPCVRRVTALAPFCVLALFGCSAPYTKVERAAIAALMPDVACLMGKLRDVADDRAVTYTVQDLAPVTAHALSYIHSRTYFTVRDRCGLGVVMDSARETCTGQVCGAL